MFFKFAPEHCSTVLFIMKKVFTPNNPKMTHSSSDLQLFKGENVFLEKKAHFWGNKTVDQCSGANLKKRVFCKNLLQISCFFKAFLQQKC